MMRGSAVVVAGLLLGLAAPALAETATRPAPAVVAQADGKRPVISFRPSAQGAPTRRVGGASRGPADAGTAALSVLATESTGLTSQAQPTLLWYVSEDVDARVELVVADTGAIDPLIEAAIPGPLRKGIQAIDLARFGKALEVGKEYVWSIALVHDEARRSLDLVSEGTIRRVAPPPGLEGVSGLPLLEQTARYAEQGLWYDAIAALSAAIRQSPQDAGLRQARADLLAQVGLADAARYDR
jgi:hypothetical protein